jgi:hypothetical protein
MKKGAPTGGRWLKVMTIKAEVKERTTGSICIIKCSTFKKMGCFTYVAPRLYNPPYRGIYEIIKFVLISYPNLSGKEDTN